MKKQDYNATIVAKTSAAEAFSNFNRVSAWWTENTEGDTDSLDSVFTIHFGEAFVTFKVVEFIPEKKVVWLVTDCYLHWLNDKKEWKDTRISCEFSTEKELTQLHFTHIGLAPGIECYDGCVKGWDQYFKDSLFRLITEGKGLPQKKAVAAAPVAE